jgi:hypothetical protein
LLPHTPLYHQNCGLCAIFDHPDFLCLLLPFWFLPAPYQLTCALGLVHSTYCTPKIRARRFFRHANSALTERHRGTPTLWSQHFCSESASSEARGRSVKQRRERFWGVPRGIGPP